MILLFTFFLLIIHTEINGQDSIFTLSPVEVTDSRIDLNTFFSGSILYKFEIQTGITGLSLSEPLANVPGLLILNRNNPSQGDKISVRGIGARASFGIRGIKILLDNIPLTLPDGQTQINNIDLNAAGKIEIIKGPLSSFYGNAAGGVINISSEMPSGHAINAYPSFILGENRFNKLSLKLSGSIHRSSYLFSFSSTNNRGFRDHSELRIYQLNTLYKNKISERLSASVVLNYFNSPYLQNPGAVDKEMSLQRSGEVREIVKFQGAGEKADQFQGGISINYQVDDSEIRTTAYYLRKNLVNPIPGRIIELKRNVFGFRSEAVNNFSYNNLNLKVSGGIDIESQSDNREEFINNGLPHLNFRPADIFENLIYGEILLNQDEKISGFGAYLSGEFFLKETLGILGVMRYDLFNYRVNDFYSSNSGRRNLNKVSPAAGILFRPSSQSRIYFNYTTSFQTPTTVELSNNEDGSGGFNKNLEPEISEQFETGADYFFKGLNSRIFLSIFQINFKQLLLPYQSDFTDEIFYRNAGKAVNRGLEVSAEFRPAQNFTGLISYNYMKFKYKNYLLMYNDVLYQMEGKSVPGIPGETFSFSLSHIPESGLAGKILIRWNDNFYTNDFNGTPPGSSSPSDKFINESYIVTDLRAGYRFNFNYIGFYIFSGIDNLFNKRYNGSVVQNAGGERYFEPSPGRFIYFGLNIDLK